MSALGLVVAFVILVAIAVLAPIFGADSRSTAADPPEVWFGHRS
jgi:hypothetical protein